MISLFQIEINKTINSYPKLKTMLIRNFATLRFVQRWFWFMMKHFWPRNVYHVKPQTLSFLSTIPGVISSIMKKIEMEKNTICKFTFYIKKHFLFSISNGKKFSHVRLNIFAISLFAIIEEINLGQVSFFEWQNKKKFVLFALSTGIMTNHSLQRNKNNDLCTIQRNWILSQWEFLYVFC